MTDTLIALISIFIGIVGANIFRVFNKKDSFDFIGNTIAGVFGSIFFIKSFGHLGFDPVSIMKNGTTNYTLLYINFFVSFLGGVLAVFLIKKLQIKLNNYT